MILTMIPSVFFGYFILTGVERIDATRVIANYAVLLPCSLLKSSGISAIISGFDAVLTALSHLEQSNTGLQQR